MISGVFLRRALPALSGRVRPTCKIVGPSQSLRPRVSRDEGRSSRDIGLRAVVYAAEVSDRRLSSRTSFHGIGLRI